MRRVNYLNNKDMLKEIHKSKTNFCSYIEPEYNQYDIILILEILEQQVSEVQ